jgi:hypothetical protein
MFALGALVSLGETAGAVDGTKGFDLSPSSFSSALFPMLCSACASAAALAVFTLAAFSAAVTGLSADSADPSPLPPAVASGVDDAPSDALPSTACDSPGALCGLAGCWLDGALLCLTDAGAACGLAGWFPVPVALRESSALPVGLPPPAEAAELAALAEAAPADAPANAAVPAATAVVAAAIICRAAEPTSPVTMLFAMNGIAAIAIEYTMLMMPTRNEPSIPFSAPRKPLPARTVDILFKCTAVISRPSAP